MRSGKGFPDIPLLLIPVMLLAVLVLVQILSYRNTFIVDLTAERLYTLSGKSLQVLDGLDGSKLEAIAFFLQDDPAAAEVSDLLSQYRRAYPAFSYELVDPTKNPKLVEQYQVGSNGTLVLSYQGRSTNLVSREEEAISNGIYRLAGETATEVYFLTGHGEKTPLGEYSKLALALEDERYRLGELLLLREEAIPAGTRIMVIAGPREPVSLYEQRLLTVFLAEGGSLLILLDPYRSGGLEDFLAAYGMLLGADTVVDERSRIMGGDVLFPIVSDYGDHPISRSLDLVSFYPIARSIEITDDSREDSLRKVDLRYLARTGSDTWSETDTEALTAGKPQFVPGEDLPGPRIIAVAGSLERPNGGGEERNEGRVVLFGDSDFAGNDYFGVGGNRDLIMNTFAWLSSETDLIGIRSRDPDHTPIILTQGQSDALFWIFIVLLPALLVSAGVAVRLLVRWKR